jgi:hypothetical protein
VERVFEPEALPNDLKAVRDDGIDAVAIVFMHAWNYPVQSDSRLHRHVIGHGQQFHCAGTRDASCRPLLGGGDANAARPKCRKDGLTETLRASDQIMLQPGEAVIVTMIILII